MLSSWISTLLGDVLPNTSSSAMYSYCNASASAIISSSFKHTFHFSSLSSHWIQSNLPSNSWSKYIRQHFALLMNRSTFSSSSCFISIVWPLDYRLNLACNASCRPSSTKMMASLFWPSLPPSLPNFFYLMLAYLLWHIIIKAVWIILKLSLAFASYLIHYFL